MPQEIWTEKYRPKKLSDIIGQEHVVPRLQHFLENKNLPHCLFAGPAGSGKTTAALCIAHELFGDEWHGNFLELNASDARGIDTIRVQVKDFARTVPMDGGFKIIYLDEADSLTRDAQHALRRTMEKYAKTCRFILACNYSGKIIPPIQSRTAVFRFSGLSRQDIIGRLKHIAEEEGLAADESAYEAIFNASEGDMRKAINVMQMASASGKVTSDTIYDVTSRADPAAVKKMLDAAIKGKFPDARAKLIELLYDRGLAGEDLVKEIHKQVFELDVDDRRKIAFIEKVGEYEFRLTEGSNPQIQLEALLAQMALVGKD